MNILTNSVSIILYNLTITNTSTIKNFKVMSDKFGTSVL
jgi:hypothetical protein